MKVFLTKVDSDIEKSIQRDPMKQQVIWTEYASTLYKHVNSLTDNIRDYIIASLGLEIIERYPKKIGRRISEEEEKDIQVLYEIIIIYILTEAIKNGNMPKKAGFIGKERGARAYSESVIINVRNQNRRGILVNQEHLGSIARYKTRIIDIRKDILKIAFGNKVDAICEEFLEVIANTYGKNRNIRYSEIFQKEDIDVKRILINTLKSVNSKKEKYLYALEIKEYKSNGLNVIYNKLEENSEKDIEQIVQEILDDNNLDEELRDKLEKICQVENFLVAITNVFYTIIQIGNANKLDAQNKELKDALDEVRKKYIIGKNEIKSNPKIYPKIIQALEEKRPDIEIIKTILEEHKIGQEKLNKRPWVELRKNKFTNEEEIILNHKIKKSEIEGWEHYYFIDVVRRIIRSMDKWEEI